MHSLDKSRKLHPLIQKGVEVLHCDVCNFTGRKGADYMRHMSTKKHARMTMCNSEGNLGDYTRIIYCEACNYRCNNDTEYGVHVLSDIHVNRPNLSRPVYAKIFYCDTCDIICKVRADYIRHINTAKHTNHAKHANNVIDVATICTHSSDVNSSHSDHHVHGLTPGDNLHITNSEFTHCIQTILAAQSDAHMSQITTILGSQSEAQAAQAEQMRLLVEAISLKGPQTIMNNTTTNNQFNLNVFLNEDCKNAYTLKEVMESIVCTVDDLDRMCKDGYIATVIRKILESMQEMTITERPIHCTDLHRNTVCIKDETGWVKGEAASIQFNNSVFFVGKRLNVAVGDWRLAYPDHHKGTESRRKQYHHLVNEVLKSLDHKLEARIAGIVCRSIVLDRKTAMTAL